jgi:hypothetical protein
MTRSVIASAHEPINPLLYRLLAHKFGDVKIANEGAPAYVQAMPDPLHPGRQLERASHWGEYYCVRCPFCADTGNKLWINHLYGADYAFNRRTRTYLAVCYKNGCLSNRGNREQLEDMIFGTYRKTTAKFPLKHVSGEFIPQPVEPPGAIDLLTTLPADHPAPTYLLSRAFVPAELEANFGVGYCRDVTSDRYAIMRRRLYIPIVQGGELLSWQGRALGEGVKPKYFNAPNTKKSHLLYNYDAAASKPFVVIVEGVPSVWRIGRPAIAPFGKSLSHWQQEKIAKTWADKPIFVLFDFDAQTDLEHACLQLKNQSLRAIPVTLPDARDPADYARDEIIALICAAGQRAGVSLSLSDFDW